jgi:predicted enzyme related to lactoylglutathione lyase
MVTGIDVHVYVVQDFERALAFYEALLGRDPSTLMPGMWAEFELPDGSAFAIGKHENFPWQPGYIVAFAVPEVGAAIDLVKTLGGKAEDPDETPVCYMSFAEDSEGNRIMLHQRKN